MTSNSNNTDAANIEKPNGPQVPNPLDKVGSDLHQVQETPDDLPPVRKEDRGQSDDSSK